MSPANIYRGIGRLRLVYDLHSVQVVAGGAGWVDTDLSATLGTPDTNKLWVVVARAGAGEYMGVRAHGETEDIRYQISYPLTFLTKLDSSGHADLYRNATSSPYYDFVGYVETV